MSACGCYSCCGEDHDDGCKFSEAVELIRKCLGSAVYLGDELDGELEAFLKKIEEAK